MKLLSTLSPILLGAVFFIACNKDKPVALSPQTSIFPDSTVDVYIAGFYGDSLSTMEGLISGAIDGRSKAMYWKNGNPIILTDGINDAQALSIAVSGNDVYVVGWEFKNNKYIPMCWKNGISTTLPDNIPNNNIIGSMATSIAISGSDVYISGFVSYTGHAKYWKNGTEIMLSNSTGRIEANSISINGNDVYVCGSEYENDQIVKPVLWKNGNRIPVNDSAQSTCSSMAFDGNDLYLAGYQLGSNAYYYQGHNYSKYWKNEIGMVIDTEYGKSNKIIVADNDVYIAGYGHANPMDTTRTAKYWKNGLSFDLPITSGPSEATGIAKFNNSLYIVGYLNNKGAVWINGNLFTTMDEHTYLTDIKVVPR